MIARLLELLRDSWTLDWLVFGDTALYVSIEHVTHVDESRQREDPYEGLDEFSRRYIKQLQRRIKQGKGAWEGHQPLIETRAQLLYFRDALTHKTA